MRDVARIQKLLRMIHELWSKQPDTRFNQLIHNLQAEYNAEKGGIYSKELWDKEEYRGITSYRKTSEVDLYNLEDEAFMEFLKKKLDGYNK